ncbi:MAG TPA: zf-HC2 domain-containing protein, partial [Candidatus Polarisedimenticolaceae bacterium]|nr:zf-HC2 domain-containing protein [Candidatus Polarisedimenticolaceae bacterium]
MSDDPVAALIPWYAAGSLEPAEAAQVERHLTGCAHCRELLAAAREFAELAAEAPSAACLAHVEPRLLVRYAE